MRAIGDLTKTIEINPDFAGAYHEVTPASMGRSQIRSDDREEHGDGYHRNVS